MSNNKQSSIEWLQEIELERDLTLADWNKAKAMHKEEIINAVQSCGYIGGATDEEAEQYYNETFNNEGLQ